MRRSFSLNTVPHEAEIGDVVLQFEPEVLGSKFLDQYALIKDAQKAAAAAGEGDPSALREVTGALREFLSAFMLPDSREVFAGMVLPDRVYVQLLEFLAEAYGMGAGETPRPTGSSSGSAKQPPNRGTR